MTLTMFYIRGMHKKSEYHSNIPAKDLAEAYAIFKHHNGEAVVMDIKPLFDFEHVEEPEPSVLVTQ